MTKMDALFHALANATRRTILDLVRESPGGNVAQLCSHFPMSRIGVMKHLKILVDADLILSIKEGRERQLYFNVIPIQTAYDRWTTQYSGLWAGRLTQLKQAIESNRPSALPPEMEERGPRPHPQTEEES